MSVFKGTLGRSPIANSLSCHSDCKVLTRMKETNAKTKSKKNEGIGLERGNWVWILPMAYELSSRATLQRFNYLGFLV